MISHALGENHKMISDMRKMAEAFLASPGTDDSQQELSPAQRRLELLCERHEAGTPVYVLYPGEGGVTRLRRQEMLSGQSWRAPWIKPGGPNSPYLVPVFKVERKKGGAESKRIRTLVHFEQMARAKSLVSSYFDSVLGVLQSNRLARLGGEPTGRAVTDAYGAAIDEIVTRDARLNKDTPLLLVATDPKGEAWPGDDARLVDWLLASIERLTIYGKPETPSHQSASCALCQGPGPLYPNALPGAGINFVNGAFRGSFPEMSEANSWQRFAVCATCADHLYIYKSHIAPEFIEPVAGSRTLIIPSANMCGNAKEFGRFVRESKRMLGQANRAEGERTVLRRLSTEATVATLSLLWAENFGQKIDGIRGFVTHVLPTRLAELEEVNAFYNQRRSTFYPRISATACGEVWISTCDLRMSSYVGPAGRRSRRRTNLPGAIPCSINWLKASSTRIAESTQVPSGRRLIRPPVRIGARYSNKRIREFSINVIRRLRSNIKATSGCP